MVTKKLGADIQITSAPNIPNGSVYLRCAKQLQQSIDYLHENDAKEYTKGDVQPHEGFPPEIDPIPMVDNLIAPVFVPFKHLRNVYAMLFEPKFNTHLRLIVAVSVLSSFFLWALCPTNFILFEW